MCRLCGWVESSKHFSRHLRRQHGIKNLNAAAINAIQDGELVLKNAVWAAKKEAAEDEIEDPYKVEPPY